MPVPVTPPEPSRGREGRRCDGRALRPTDGVCVYVCGDGCHRVELPAPQRILRERETILMPRATTVQRGKNRGRVRSTLDRVRALYISSVNSELAVKNRELPRAARFSPRAFGFRAHLSRGDNVDRAFEIRRILSRVALHQAVVSNRGRIVIYRPIYINTSKYTIENLVCFAINQLPVVGDTENG